MRDFVCTPNQVALKGSRLLGFVPPNRDPKTVTLAIVAIGRSAPGDEEDSLRAFNQCFGEPEARNGASFPSPHPPSRADQPTYLVREGSMDIATR